MAYTNIPANLFDYFNKLNERLRKLESAPDMAMTTASQATVQATQATVQATQAIQYAQSAASQAAIAQTQAVQALTQAQSAYALGAQSIQINASTIVNASNQLIAIASNGITVYSGSSSSSGARVVMNSAGLAGYNTSGTATFSLSASDGSLSLSGALFSGGSITGSSLNIAGNFIVSSSGVVQAYSATIVGTINATAGYFGSASNGWSISSTGLTGVGTGNITGGAISGTSISGSTITGGTIQTSSGSTSVYLDSTYNALRFKQSGSNVGNIVPLSSFGVIMHYGSTPDGSGGTFPQVYVGSSNAAMFASSSYGISSTTTGNGINGNTTLNTGSLTITSGNFYISSGNFYYGSSYTSHSSSGSTGDLPLYENSSGYVYTKSSSQRFKKDIQNATIQMSDILTLNPSTYVSNESFEANGNSAQGLNRVLGLIAEEVAQIDTLKDLLVGYDEKNTPFSVSYDALAVALIPAIKNLNDRLLKIEGTNGNTSGSTN